MPNACKYIETTYHAYIQKGILYERLVTFNIHLVGGKPGTCRYQASEYYLGYVSKSIDYSTTIEPYMSCFNNLIIYIDSIVFNTFPLLSLDCFEVQAYGISTIPATDLYCLWFSQYCDANV